MEIAINTNISNRMSNVVIPKKNKKEKIIAGHQKNFSISSDGKFIHKKSTKNELLFYLRMHDPKYSNLSTIVPGSIIDSTLYLSSEKWSTFS